MNESKTTQFATLIRDLLAGIEVENQRGLAGQAVVELDQQSVGRLSRMDALQNQAMAKAQAARRDVETRRLQAALRRMDEGEFGYCDACGDEIAHKRLELDPAAAKCISCASA